LADAKTTLFWRQKSATCVIPFQDAGLEVRCPSRQQGSSPGFGTDPLTV